MAEISISVNGQLLKGWLSASVNAGIDKIARAFSLSITKDFPNFEQMPIKSGDLCEVYIDNDKVLSGYVDSVPISYNASGINITVNGRSKTCDLIDCCMPPKGTQINTSKSWTSSKSDKAINVSTKSLTKFDNKRVDEIIANLCSPFGVSVLVTQELADIKTNFSVTIGQTIAQSIAKLMLVDNLIITDNEHGELVISKVGDNGTCSDTLALGVNILSASSNRDYSKLYSDYNVYGQKATADDESANLGASSYGTAHNDLVQRARYTDIKMQGQQISQSCKTTAISSVNFANAQAKQVSVTVQGWKQSNGDLWRINSLVNLNDSILGYNNVFLIKDITYSVGSNGTTTSLVLIDPLAYKSDKVVVEMPSASTPKAANDKPSKWADVKPIE